MNLDNLIGAAKRALPHEAHGDLDELLRQPEVQAIRQRSDDEALAHRTALLERLQALPAEHEKALADAALKAQWAADRVQKLRAELDTAMAGHVEAARLQVAAGFIGERDRGLIERQLMEGSDPRLTLMVACLDDLFQTARNVLHWSLRLDRLGEFSSKATMVHNGSDVDAACDALREGQARCRALMLQALTRQQIDDELQAIALDACSVLQPLGLRAGIAIDSDGMPRLDGGTSAVMAQRRDTERTENHEARQRPSVRAARKIIQAAGG